MHNYEAEVTNVVDGDTVDVDIDLGFSVFVQHRLRLAGIDAPEKRGDTRKAGKEAKKHLEMLIKKLSPVQVMTIRSRSGKDKQGKYGRYLARLVGKDGSDINELMILDGHAVRM